jgi:septal ring factor EnvC (AmiA/AmiB activator)
MTPQIIEELLRDPVFRLKFLELLDRDPAFWEEVRRKLLTDELLALPERVERLRLEIHGEFERVWAAIHENSRQIAALAERMERVEAQIAALTQQVQENSRQIAALREEMRELRRTVGRMEERWGLVHENMAEDLMPRFLALTGRQVQRSAMVQFDGEADLVLEVEEANGRRATWVV